jgi:ERF superfamily
MIEITKALIKARRNFKTVAFDRNGQRNKYATLKSILVAVDDALMDEGILFTQSEIVDKDYQCPILETRLMHVSGESISSRALIANDEKSPITNENQRYGAALSYARRYSAMTILGLYADESDVDDHEYNKGSNQVEARDMGMATEKQIGFIKKLLSGKERSQEIVDRILKKYNIKSLEEVASKDASEIIKTLQGQ